MFSPRAHLVLLLCTFLLAAGCAGNGPGPAASPTPTGQPATASLETIQTTIFNVHCLFAGCHNSSDRSGNMVLEAGAAYSNLVNVTPFNDAARMRGLLRVAPGDPDHSFLIIKLTGPPSDEGVRMPAQPPLLSTAEITLVRDWILAGAPAPGGATAVPTVTPTPTPSATPTATV